MGFPRISFGLDVDNLAKPRRERNTEEARGTPEDNAKAKKEKTDYIQPEKKRPSATCTDSASLPKLDITRREKE
ncbi:hypothetical protein ANO14919_046210 [Xylariales sp. No.14919]|nr:hypothetical protein ANO14919_046210 [Xylariales sp. No.14919]